MRDEGESPGDAEGATESEGSPGSGERRGGDADEEKRRERLEALRERIEAVDEELIRLVGERRALVLEIGRLKKALGLPVLDPAREARVVRRAAERSRELGVDEELTRHVIWRIIASAREAQEGRSSWGPPEPPRSADAGDEDR